MFFWFLTIAFGNAQWCGLCLCFVRISHLLLLLCCCYHTLPWRQSVYVPFGDIVQDVLVFVGVGFVVPGKPTASTATPNGEGETAYSLCTDVWL